jgi:hypothetical protein
MTDDRGGERRACACVGRPTSEQPDGTPMGLPSAARLRQRPPNHSCEEEDLNLHVLSDTRT